MKEHPSFWVSLWQSDDFVSLVNRIVMVVSASAGGWLVARGYVNAELAGLIGLFLLTVSQKFSSWNRGRATAKAASDVAGLAAMPGEVAAETTGQSGAAPGMRVLLEGKSLRLHDLPCTTCGHGPFEGDLNRTIAFANGEVKVVRCGRCPGAAAVGLSGTRVGPGEGGAT